MSEGVTFFYLPKPRRNFSGQLGGQTIKNGCCVVIDADADKVARILCRYYAAIKSKKAPSELANKAS